MSIDVVHAPSWSFPPRLVFIWEGDGTCVTLRSSRRRRGGGDGARRVRGYRAVVRTHQRSTRLSVLLLGQA